MKSEVFLAGGVRTPIGGFMGAFAETSAVELGSIALKAALERAGLPGDRVDEVIFGNVLGAGQGQNVARQVAVRGGLPDTVCGMTINKVCGSGLKSVALAAQAIQCGDAAAIVAGGTENMSRAPYLLPKARGGYRMGNGELLDSLVHDGLWDVFHVTHMGKFGDACGTRYELSREDQDDFAVESYRRALRSSADGHFKAEIVPVEVTTRKGSITVSEDEEPKRFNEEKLRSLRPAFGRDGAVTAGNASSINDGAAAVTVLSPEIREELGIKADAKILGYASSAHEPEWFTTAPVGAMRNLFDGTGLTVDDVDVFEINEAFSVVPMAAMRELDIPREKVNVLGGAVALGHPIGASGARTLVTLINALRVTGGKVGVDALCIGGGQGIAMAVELVGD